MPGPLVARASSPEARMGALSFLVLYLELALIRWVSGYVHNFGYFTNFAMLGAFLGIGVGCLLTERLRVVAYFPAALMALSLIVRVANLQIDLPPESRNAVFWSEALSTDGKVSPTLMVVVLFLLIAFAFVGLGQIMGELFGELPRLRAYGCNVSGGLAGILVFALGSRLNQGPLVWFSVVVVVALPFLATAPRVVWVSNAMVLAMFLWVVGFGTKNETWSPYYRQTLVKAPNGVGYALVGNGIAGITIGDFEHLSNAAMYQVPYSPEVRAHRTHPDAPIANALVIGCGAGNDVAMALANGVQHVDAVDINPWVIDVGEKYHPLKPFASDKVTTYVADGREFLARPGPKYDLIVYGLPDSTFTNDRANLRVESFIFTTEAFKEVESRLSDHGIFVVYNYYRVLWLVEKIHGMLRDASGQEPYTRAFLDKDGHPLPALPVAMAVGPGLRLGPPGHDPAPEPATDDWPFLYLVGPSIPDTYLKALGAVGLVSLLLIGATLRLTRGDQKQEKEDPRLLAALFFMGLAFVLLETRSVVTFGLFFGSTWWNNVVVFAAIHVSVLLAVMVNSAFPGLPRGVMVAALLGSLAFAWGLPPEVLLVGGTATRAVLAGTVAFLPIFCANVFFASMFAATREGRVSYAWNLLGGMLGGLFEYVSLLGGYRILVALAALFYLFALLFAYRYSLSVDARTSVKLAPSTE